MSIEWLILAIWLSLLPRLTSLALSHKIS
jgi:hypothetical protein